MAQAVIPFQKKLIYLLGIAAFLSVAIGASQVLPFGDTGKTHNDPTHTPVMAVQPVQINPATSDQLFDLTNEARTKRGLAPYTRNPLLDKSAKLKGEEMEKTGVYAHSSPSGKHGYSYIRDVGARCNYASENIAPNADIITSNSLFKGWMDSKKGHRGAILSTEHNQIGIYVSKHYAVQHFCQSR